MKRKILFVMNSLHCGGAEKSLAALLRTIDYSLYQVDLLLFKREGILLNQIPEQVRILEEPQEFIYFDMPFKRALIESLRAGRWDIAWSRLCAGYLFKKEKNAARCEQRVWHLISKTLKKLNTRYDAAIGYLEKSPVYFVIDKVNAGKKFGVIHTDYDKMGMDEAIDRPFFAKLDYLVSVSKESVELLKKRFPMYRDKIVLLHNIVSPPSIVKLSSEPMEIIRGSLTIASVGRLIRIKGFDMAVEACEMLVRDGYDVKWYLIGEGPDRSRLEQLIGQKGLQDNLILAGLQENPYPYIKQCDIYVQTSWFEGRCLTITEAKILNKPIVSTNFEVIYDQLTNEHNGLIVDRGAHSIYEGIKRLSEDERLKEKFIANLQNEDLGTEREVERLYQWIG